MHKPPLFTGSFILAACASLMLSLAAFLFVHYPGFLHALGAGEAEIGRIMGAQAAGALLAWPFVGRAMDVRGRRTVILGGCALFVVVVALYLFVNALGHFVYVVRLLDGVAHTMWYTALFTYGADLVPVQRRTEGLAIFGVSAIVPIGLGAIFGDVVLLYLGYRELFLIALGLAIAGAALCLPLRDLPNASAEAAMPTRGLFASVTERSLLPIWVAAFVFFLALFGLFSFMKTFVATTGIGTVGGFFGAYALMALLLRLFMGWVPDRVGPRRMLGVAMLCYALGFAALSLAKTPLLVLLAGALCGAGHGYTYPVLFSLVVSRAIPAERGAAVACYTAIDWLGLLAAGPAVGLLIEWSGYTFAFAGLGVALVAGMVAFYLLDRAAAAVLSSS